MISPWPGIDVDRLDGCPFAIAVTADPDPGPGIGPVDHLLPGAAVDGFFIHRAGHRLAKNRGISFDNVDDDDDNISTIWIWILICLSIGISHRNLDLILRPAGREISHSRLQHNGATSL